jgi:streptogramin lyase
VFRIDPRTTRVVSTIPVPGSLDDIAVGEGSVWILDSTAGTLSSIRPDTEEVRDPFPVGSDPIALDVGLGAVWVAGGKQGILTRINSSTRAQEEIHVGGPVSDIAVDEDENVVWVTIS